MAVTVENHTLSEDGVVEDDDGVSLGWETFSVVVEKVVAVIVESGDSSVFEDGRTRRVDDTVVEKSEDGGPTPSIHEVVPDSMA